MIFLEVLSKHDQKILIDIEKITTIKEHPTEQKIYVTFIDKDDYIEINTSLEKFGKQLKAIIYQHHKH